MVQKIAGILMTIILVIGLLPLIGPEVKIEWTTYLGMPLVILLGSTGVAFIGKRFEAIIGGMVIGVLWPVVIEIIKSV